LGVLKLPRFEDVPQMARFLEGTHNYDMDKHTRLIYHPISGVVYKRRFVMAMEMLGKCVQRGAGRIVEVGYGAGLLFPTLSGMARKVVGVDLMDTRASAAVRGMLERLQIGNVTLLNASVLDIPLAANSADALLCLSILEHLHRGEEMERAAASIRRVLRPGGVAILGFPVKNIITRALFKILGYDDDVIHPSSHTDIIHGFEGGNFSREVTRVYPAFLPMDLSLYALVTLRKPN
jgi:SAM-dependent methyltransferase